MEGSIRLVEGSEIKVTCAACGQHQWLVTIIPGHQQLMCPKCKYRTEVEFWRDKEGGFGMRSYY